MKVLQSIVLVTVVSAIVFYLLFITGTSAARFNVPKLLRQFGISQTVNHRPDAFRDLRG